MKKLLVLLLISISVFAATALAQGLSQIGIPGLANPADDVTVIPYAQVGFQRVGSNINLPIRWEGPIAGLLQIDQMDIALQDTNLWTGTAGVTFKKGEMLSLFGSVGGSLPRTVAVSGEIPVGLGPIGSQPTVDFTASQISMWYAQGGVSLGPILLGLYGDHFGIEVGEPRIGSRPLNNQTLRGDIITTTLAPFIGFTVPASNGLLTATYSPLAQSNTTLVLRTSTRNVTQLQYTWNKPGNLFTCNFQYTIEPMKGSSLGLWAGYLYMEIRGHAELDYRNSTQGYLASKGRYRYHDEKCDPRGSHDELDLLRGTPAEIVLRPVTMTSGSVRLHADSTATCGSQEKAGQSSPFVSYTRNT